MNEITFEHSPNRKWAGIGSRSTPGNILTMLPSIANTLKAHGFILRSGGAPGADTAFEAGVREPDKKEIYLPWQGFNKNPSPRYNITDEALALAEKFHPNWNALTHGGKCLMARNGYQILGENLDDPVAFVICWTPHGLDVGGTSQAIRIARAYNIPVYNLGVPYMQDQIYRACRLR